MTQPEWGLADLVAAVGGAERVVTLADPEAFAVGAVFLGANEPKSAEEPASLEVLAEQVAVGTLIPLPVTTYPLETAATAHRDGEVNRLKGKAVLIP